MPLFAVVAALAAAAAAEHIAPLSTAELDDAWREHELLLVEFFVEGSSSHAQLAPVLPAAAKAAAARGAEAQLRTVDMEREPRLRKRFHIPQQVRASVGSGHRGRAGSAA
jgi:hypothetical protein